MYELLIRADFDGEGQNKNTVEAISQKGYNSNLFHPTPGFATLLLMHDGVSFVIILPEQVGYFGT
jgi:hypothetical protein